jgi:hypothetical protein
MAPTLDERLRWLADRDLYAFIRGLALKLTSGKEQEAMDLVQETYLWATGCVVGGGGPMEQPGIRPWLCTGLKNRTLKWAAKKKIEVAFSPEDFPEPHAEDAEQTFERHAEMKEHDRRAEAAEDALARHPEQARLVAPAVGDQEPPHERAPVGATERKQKQRARAILAAAILAAAMFGALLSRAILPAPSTEEANLHTIAPDPDAIDERKIAAGTRALGLRSCKEGDWARCILLLDQSAAVGDAGPDPVVRAARDNALAEKARLDQAAQPSDAAPAPDAGESDAARAAREKAEADRARLLDQRRKEARDRAREAGANGNERPREK